MRRPAAEPLQAHGATEVYENVSEHVFPFLRTVGGQNGNHSKHMKDARFTIQNAALLARVVDMADKVP